MWRPVPIRSACIPNRWSWNNASHSTSQTSGYGSEILIKRLNSCLNELMCFSIFHQSTNKRYWLTGNKEFNHPLTVMCVMDRQSVHFERILLSDRGICETQRCGWKPPFHRWQKTAVLGLCWILRLCSRPTATKFGKQSGGQVEMLVLVR